MPEEKSEQLTQVQKEQLEAELAELEGPKRAEAVEAIASARSFGDLSENFEYHAAKNEQGERMQVEISSVGGVSPESPVGRALLGKKVGDEVVVDAPRGSWRARIISVG